MAESVDTKTYELAFHIDPDLEENEARNHFQELAGLISAGGGKIVGEKEPRRIRLSYPIRKKQAGYFGIFNFSAPPEAIEKINTQLKLRSDLMRYLLLLAPDSKNLRVLGERRYRPRTKVGTEEKKDVTVRPKEKAAESGEQLEQEVEKIIENL